MASERNRTDPVPAASVRRLSLYLRHLEGLDAAGRKTIASRELGKSLDLTDAQVRKDLAHFGQFGYPGVGYRVPDMVRTLRGILGTDRAWKVLLVGTGNLGRALASHPGFVQKGLRLAAAFDADPAKVGQPLGEVTVQPMSALGECVNAAGIRLAILAVTPESAQEVTDALVKAGIRGILNFAPVTLAVPDHVSVNSVDLAAQLEQLVFQLQDRSG